MTNPRFTKKFRDTLSEKLMDLGNLVAVGLVFGQLITDKFSIEGFLVGIAVALVCYIISYILSKHD